MLWHRLIFTGASGFLLSTSKAAMPEPDIIKAAAADARVKPSVFFMCNFSRKLVDRLLIELPLCANCALIRA
jgi:hypothetical protein